jgi:hypothetical protein
MAKVILPITSSNYDEPLIFLAGPMAKAPNWRLKAIEYIKKYDTKELINIASPDYNVDEKYWKNNPRRVDDLPMESGRDPQIEWEIEHREKALRKGCVLFWLSKPLPEYDNYPIGLNTRLELGIDTMKALKNNGKIVVGMGDYFTGMKFIRSTLMRENPSIKIKYTLEDTCKTAVELINN